MAEDQWLTLQRVAGVCAIALVMCECWGVPSGGGAAMAYVVVFLFGGWLALMVSKLPRR